MQLSASIDESDLGQVQPDQPVSFRVDSYPSQTFRGTVSQVRLNPTTVSNVVTYAAIIDAPNPGLKLKPGMTANLTIEVARRDDVLRVPSAALRFKPDAETLVRFGVKTAAPSAAKAATVWVSSGTSITPVSVQPGATDGSQTEVQGAPFAEGALVVTRASASGAATAAKSATSAGTGNPLMPAARGPGGPRPPGM
jgi:HlyD family secretion protein